MSNNPSGYPGMRTHSGAVTVWIALAVGSFAVFAGNYLDSEYLKGRELWGRALAADIEVHSLQLATQAKDAVSGDEDAFAALKRTRDAIQADIYDLREGKGLYSGFGQSMGIGAPLQKLADTWAQAGTNAELILRNQERALAVARNAEKFYRMADPMQSRMDEVARAMSDSGASPAQLLLAMREIMLIDRLKAGVARVLSGGESPDSPADSLARMSALFESVLKGFQQGDASLGIVKLDKPTEVMALKAVAKLDSDTRLSIDAILKDYRQYIEIQMAGMRLAGGSTQLLRDSSDVTASFDSLSLRRLFPSMYIGLLSGLMSLLGIVRLAIMRKGP